ncbi:MAG: hypothetical protein ACREME_01405 [Gemmatimonadales bacterium]
MREAIDLFFLILAVVTAPVLAVAGVQVLMRRFGLWTRPAGRQQEPRDDVNARLAELGDLARRVAELEERVDFAERVLAQRREAPAPALKPRS